MFQQSNDGAGVVRCLLSQVIGLRFKGLTDQALLVAQKALADAADPALAPELAEAHYQVGMCAAQLGMLGDAALHLKEALASFEEAGDLARASSCHQYLGVVYEGKGDLMLAGVHVDAAIRGWQNLGNQPRLASCLNSRGVLSHSTGDLELAEECLARSLAICEDLGLKRIKGYALSTLGDVLREMGRLPEALQSYQRGTELATEIRDRHLLAELKSNEAYAHSLAGRSGTAARLVEEALQESRATDDRRGLVASLIAKACISYSSGDLATAQRDMDEATSAVSSPDRAAQGQILLLQAAAFLAQGESGAAKQALASCAAIVAEMKTAGFLKKLSPLAKAAIEFACPYPELFPAFATLESGLRQSAVPAVPSESSSAGAEGVLNVEVYALGHTELYASGEVVPASRWRSGKAKELLLYLATNSVPCSKERIIEDLWPECPPGRRGEQLPLHCLQAATGSPPKHH